MQSWDSASKASELADYSVCTTWGRKGARLYLLHVLRKRLEYPDLKRAVAEQMRMYGAQIVLIEDKSSGTQLIQELREEGVYGVQAYKPEGDKIMRMLAQTPTIENGFVFLPKEASWKPEYIHEMCAFPKGQHDDQVDSTAQALHWIKVSGFEPAIFRWIREETERAKGGQQIQTRRLQGPPNPGVFQVHGMDYYPDQNGCFDVPSDTFVHPMPLGWSWVNNTP